MAHRANLPRAALLAGLVFGLTAFVADDQAATNAGRPSAGAVTFSDDGRNATFQSCNLSVRFSGHAYRRSAIPIPSDLVTHLESIVTFRYSTDDYVESATCLCFDSVQPAQLDRAGLIAKITREASGRGDVILSSSWDEKGRFGKTLDYESIVSGSDGTFEFFDRMIYLPHCLFQVSAGAVPDGDIAKAAEFRNAIRPPMDLTDRAVPVKRAPQTDSHQLL